MEIIGWLGSICFSICAMPQSYISYKQGHSRGLSALTLVLWCVGEVLTLIYVWSTAFSLPLITNYLFNLGCLSVIITFRLFPRSEK